MYTANKGVERTHTENTLHFELAPYSTFMGQLLGVPWGPPGKGAEKYLRAPGLVR